MSNIISRNVVKVPGGEPVTVCVRLNMRAGRAPSYTVFVDGGVLACGLEDATFADVHSAMRRAADEASSYILGM